MIDPACIAGAIAGQGATGLARVFKNHVVEQALGHAHEVGQPFAVVGHVVALMVELGAGHPDPDLAGATFKIQQVERLGPAEQAGDLAGAGADGLPKLGERVVGVSAFAHALVLVTGPVDHVRDQGCQPDAVLAGHLAEEPDLLHLGAVPFAAAQDAVFQYTMVDVFIFGFDRPAFLFHGGKEPVFRGQLLLFQALKMSFIAALKMSTSVSKCQFRLSK